MDINNLVVLQLMMFLIMFLGVFAGKKGIITPSGRGSLIDLIINLILPCNIINSFRVEMTLSILVSSGIVLLIALGIQIICLFLSKVLYRKVEHGKRMVLQYGTICSNAGFLGNPVVEGIYGASGQLYASVYLIPLRVFMWSAGLSCFTKADRKEVIKKVLTHPCIVAVYIGFAVMFSGAELPAFIGQSLDSMSNCTTALSMLVIGAILSEVNFRTVVSKLTLYYCSIRLLLIPGLILAAGLVLRIDTLLIGVSVVLSGMPAGATTAILAAKYGGDAEYASKIVFVSTLLSMITVPAFCILLEYLG